MTYPEFIKEMEERHGDGGITMALRAEIGFLRKYLKEKYGGDFTKAEESNIEDFLARHPK